MRARERPANPNLEAGDGTDQENVETAPESTAQTTKWACGAAARTANGGWLPEVCESLHRRKRSQVAPGGFASGSQLPSLRFVLPDLVGAVPFMSKAQVFFSGLISMKVVEVTL
jgi:hypothetical protein